MNTDKNKESAMAYYRMAFTGNPREAVKRFVGNQYTQHNPEVEDGPEGFINYFERMHEEYPDKSIQFLRCIAEGDLVALHTHQIWPGEEEYITMDFFRFNTSGKIVEHWDSIQRIPEKAKNENGMC